MLKLFILLALTIVIFIQTMPAYCGGSTTMVFHVSATMPEHIIINNNPGLTLDTSNPYQLVQTQIVMRNNRSVILTSIVVP